MFPFHTEPSRTGAKQCLPASAEETPYYQDLISGFIKTELQIAGIRVISGSGKSEPFDSAADMNEIFDRAASSCVPFSGV